MINDVDDDFATFNAGASCVSVKVQIVSRPGRIVRLSTPVRLASPSGSASRLDLTGRRVEPPAGRHDLVQVERGRRDVRR